MLAADDVINLVSKSRVILVKTAILATLGSALRYFLTDIRGNIIRHV